MIEITNAKQRKLFESVQVLDDCGCWVWQGQVANSGYGKTRVVDENNEIKVLSAQKASYIAFVGALPDKYLVKQSCGKRLCINPEHLTLVEV